MNSLYKYEPIAVALASVSVLTESFSIIDRIANALSYESVVKAIYESGRILESAIRSGISEGEEWIKQSNNEVLIKRKNKDIIYKIHGKLPDETIVREFLEAAKDVRIARVVASYAMNIAASCLTRYSSAEKSSFGGEKQ